MCLLFGCHKKSPKDLGVISTLSFGQKLIIGDLNRAIFELDEVRYSTIDNLSQDVDIDFNEIMQLNNLTVNVNLLD